MKSFFFSAFAILCAALFTPIASGAAAYPAKSITIIVPFPPGGGPDRLARMIGEKLLERLGQKVIVENKPGASGMLGASLVAKAAPDGYTLMMTPNTFVLSALIMPKSVVPFDVQTDFAPVILPSKGVMLLAAHPSLGVKNAQGLVQYIKKNPGLAYTGSSSGSPMQVAGEMFKRAANIDMQFISYKGTLPAITDAVGGHVKVVFGESGTLAPYLKSGALVELGALDSVKDAVGPTMPSLIDQGFPEMTVKIWNGLYAPRNTPREVIDLLNRELNAILQLPDIREKLQSTGQILVGGGPETLAKEVQSDLKTFAAIVKTANIRPD
jgi:tripartite-type tricarboxylate transporter receptor subunit TctC